MHYRDRNYTKWVLQEATDALGLDYLPDPFGPLKDPGVLQFQLDIYKAEQEYRWQCEAMQRQFDFEMAALKLGFDKR